MNHESTIRILAAVRESQHRDYRKQLADAEQLELTLTSDVAAGRALLAEANCADVLVMDASLPGAFESIPDLRTAYPNLLIVLVDPDADFGTPGPADDLSVDPFTDDDLLKRVKRLAEDRRLETLRTDTLLSVRAVARALRRAGPGVARLQAAVEAIYELGYTYVAYYGRPNGDAPVWELQAQTGPADLIGVAPQRQDQTSLVGWIGQNGQSRIICIHDHLTHPFISDQRLCFAAGIPVGTALRFGVIFAGREQASAITESHVRMLELVSAQLASALAREARA